jgi:chromosome segregation ATPase
LRIECLSTELETLVSEKNELSKKVSNTHISLILTKLSSFNLPSLQYEDLEAEQESSQVSLAETTSRLVEAESRRQALETSCETVQKMFDEKQAEAGKLFEELVKLREELKIQSVTGLNGMQEKSSELLQLTEQMKVIDTERAKAAKENENLVVTVAELQHQVKTLKDKITEVNFYLKV